MSAREGEIILSGHNCTTRVVLFEFSIRIQSHLVISRGIRARENSWIVDDSDGRREERATAKAAVKRQVEKRRGCGELNWGKARRDQVDGVCRNGSYFGLTYE